MNTFLKTKHIILKNLFYSFYQFIHFKLLFYLLISPKNCVSGMFIFPRYTSTLHAKFVVKSAKNRCNLWTRCLRPIAEEPGRGHPSGTKIASRKIWHEALDVRSWSIGLSMHFAWQEMPGFN